MTYQSYKEQCIELGFKPTMTEKQWCEMQGVELSEMVRPNKDSRPAKTTHKNYMEVEDV